MRKVAGMKRNQKTADQSFSEPFEGQDLGAIRAGDAAGGDLTGTFPNPSVGEQFQDTYPMDPTAVHRHGTESIWGPKTFKKSITSTLGTITTSQPAFTATQTWNAGGVVFTAQFLNVTDTASDATSKLADWQVGGVTKFMVDKVGTTTWGDSATFNFGTGTGTKIGATNTQKLSLWGATPIVQPAAPTATAASVATTAATNAAPYGYTTAAQADDLVALVNSLKVTVDQLVTKLQALGATA